MNFGKPEIKHGAWGIGDMDVHFYISPSLSPAHKQATRDAIKEFVGLFPNQKDWFKLKEMPYQGVADIVNNQPTNLKDITDLHLCYYKAKFDEIYNDNKSPLTIVLVLPHNFVSANNGSGGDSYNSALIFDLQNTDFLKSTIKHELGHRFGCGHCNDSNCIMNQSGVGTHFCPTHKKEMQMRIATMFTKSRPYTFGQPTKPHIKFGEPTER